VSQDIGLEYNRYLQEVVQALESDPKFREKLEKAEVADIRVRTRTIIKL
jgi:nucleobindin